MTLRTVTASAACLAVLLTAAISATAARLQALDERPRQEEPAVTFLAPFTTIGFLEAVYEESERRRIFRERSTAIHLDKKTRRVWTARDNGLDIDWRRAGDYCSELELADFDDWRLPTLEELETLLEPMARTQYSTPEGLLLTACCPWSSTKKDEVSAWNFNFRFRKPFSGSMTHTYDLRALCVRDWLEADGLPVAPEDDPSAQEPDPLQEE